MAKTKSSRSELLLPWPPSINHYYRNVGGRTLISRKGREYRGTVGALVAGANLPPFAPEARLVAIIDVFPPDRRRRDLDNIQKPVLDALEHAGVYEDDSQIDILVTRRGGVVPGGGLRVVLALAAAVTWSERLAPVEGLSDE